MNYTKISRQLLGKIQFRVMSEADHMGFSGVSSPVPLIGEIDSEGILVVIDGGRAELYCDDADGSFDCVDTCENINELPM